MPVADRATGATSKGERLREAEVRLARLEERQQADREARILAAKEIDRRLGGMNELREQINTERGLYVDRDTADERHGLLIAGQSDLNARLTRVEANDRASRRATAVMIGAATLVISLVVAIANLIP